MLEIRDLTKFYIPPGNQVLDSISFTLEPGQIVGLFGENGAGKTTLLKCILGLLSHRGKVLLDGQPIGRQNIHRLSFATCEHSFFPGIHALAHRDFYAEHFPNFQRQRFDALMDFFGLPTTRDLGSMSAGQQNQFEVILALCQGADYILMDEPFAGNDVFNREDFYKVLLAILEPRETILLSTHLIEEVEPILSRVLLLRSGVLVGDQTTEALQNRGRTVLDYVKQTYRYQPDRVGRVVERLAGEED